VRNAVRQRDAEAGAGDSTSLRVSRPSEKGGLFMVNVLRGVAGDARSSRPTGGD
jgi:hypothetical protein